MLVRFAFQDNACEILEYSGMEWIFVANRPAAKSRKLDTPEFLSLFRLSAFPIKMA
jgi:hypothetical protein